jgi:hypothetical protein
LPVIETPGVIGGTGRTTLPVINPAIAAEISKGVRAGTLPNPSHNMLKNLLEKEAARIQFL